MIDHDVTVSPGPPRSLMAQLGAEGQKLADALARIEVQDKLIKELQERVINQTREIKRLRDALHRVEQGYPLNPNDEALLTCHRVSLSFDLPFGKDKHIKLTRRSGSIVTEARGPEDKPLLANLMVNARKKLRGRA